jgi:hypothetical protein
MQNHLSWTGNKEGSMSWYPCCCIEKGCLEIKENLQSSDPFAAPARLTKENGSIWNWIEVAEGSHLIRNPSGGPDISLVSPVDTLNSATGQFCGAHTQGSGYTADGACACIYYKDPDNFVFAELRIIPGSPFSKSSLILGAYEAGVRTEFKVTDPVTTTSSLGGVRCCYDGANLHGYLLGSGIKDSVATAVNQVDGNRIAAGRLKPIPAGAALDIVARHLEFVPTDPLAIFGGEYKTPCLYCIPPCGGCKNGFGVSGFLVEVPAFVDGTCDQCLSTAGTYLAKVSHGIGGTCRWVYKNTGSGNCAHLAEIRIDLTLKPDHTGYQIQVRLCFNPFGSCSLATSQVLRFEKVWPVSPEEDKPPCREFDLEDIPYFPLEGDFAGCTATGQSIKLTSVL